MKLIPHISSRSRICRAWFVLAVLAAGTLSTKEQIERINQMGKYQGNQI
jgi:hypothetical protein